MSEIWMRHVLQTSSVPGAVTTRDLCPIALEQAQWADRCGAFDRLQLGEHHGSPDGYNPSPLILGAAFAARTSRIRLHVLVMLPFHDPVRIAEDACVLDNLSGGRVDLTIGLGYVPSELALFGVERRERGRIVEEKVDVLRRALSGERFSYGERQIYVAPRPVQQPHPPIYIAGTLPISARRAARYGDGFYPISLSTELLREYEQACHALGKPTGPIFDTGGPIGVYVTEDPDRSWAQIGPYLLYEFQTYSRWTGEGDTKTSFSGMVLDSAARLRDGGFYQVVTPDQCLALVHDQRKKNRVLCFNPLVGGLPPELSWPSLELFAAKVVPRLPPRTPLDN